MEIFDSTPWMTRDCCGQVPQYLKVLYLMGSTLIVLSYFLIPAFLYKLWYKKREALQFPWIQFCLFIILCGVTHLADIMAFWYPAYCLFTILLLVTGIVSFMTALRLPGVVSNIMSMKTANEYQIILEQRDGLEQEKGLALLKIKEQNLLLRQEIHAVRNELNNLIFKVASEEKVASITTHLDKIRSELKERGTS